jgi:hypothetical protein
MRESMRTITQITETGPFAGGSHSVCHSYNPRLFYVDDRHKPLSDWDALI